MIFGSSEEFVAGTVHLVDVEGNLDVKKQGDDNIILRPPPSSNPHDPLRWTKMKKISQFNITFWLAVFLALTVNWTGPVWLLWIEELNCTYNELNISVVFCYLFLGLGCVFLQPTALKLGRRFVYLSCALIMVAANILGANATRVEHLYAVNILGGFAAAPCDSLVEISTTDVFFQHERASYLSWMVLALYGGSYIGPALSGLVVDAIGWRWSFYIQAVLFGVTFVILFFFLEDTTFRRESEDANLEEDIIQQIKSRETAEINSGKEHKSDGNVIITSGNGSDSESIDNIPPLTYKQKIGIIQTRYNDRRSWPCIMYRPFFMILFPALMWAGLVYGAQMMWLSYLVTTQATVYGLAPYFFTTSQIGFTNFAPLVGSILGLFFGGRFVDWITIKLATRNNGIMEPEFRLYAMVIPTITNSVGLLAYGLPGVTGAHWAISVIIGQGFLGLAMSSSGAICLTYAIDCYGKMASEGMVLVLFIRNMIGMGFTFAIEPWLSTSGFRDLTWLLFMLAFVINGTFIIFIIWGKKFRKWTEKTYERFSDPSFGEIFH